MVEVVETIQKLHGITVGLKFFFSVLLHMSIITITFVASVREDASSLTIRKST